MATKVFKCVILGAPASGKGTISSRIANKFKLQHISSGDKLRLNISNKTELGLQAQKFIDEGKLVPDTLMVQFIINEIQKLSDKSWLLDGFPRTVSQAKALWAVQPVDLVINLNVPFEVIVDRVKGRWVHLPSGRVYNTDFNAPKVPGKDDITGEALIKRNDDTPEVVLRRLQEYKSLTTPVVQYYENLGIIQEFVGCTSDEIWPKVSNCLVSYLPPAGETMKQNH